MAAQVVPATQEQVAAALKDGQRFESYAPQVNAAVVRRWLWFNTLAFENVGLRRGLLDLQANERANKSAEIWAQAMRALELGRAELCPTSKDGGRTIALGVVQRGTLPETLQVWPVLPLVVLAVGAVGVWLLADAWLTARTIEAEALRLHAENQAAVTKAIASAKTPADAQALADALAKANNAVKAPTPAPGIIDQIAAGIGNVFKAAGKAATESGTEIALVAAFLFYAFSRRKGRA